MQKSANLNIRMNPEVKEEAENILKELGITPSNAIDMFYRQIIITKGLPFELRLPEDHPLNIENISENKLNELLEAGIKSLNEGRYHSAEEVLARIREAGNTYE